MIKIDRESFSSPLAIFFIFILASGLAVFGFRFIFPAERVPLGYFSTSWRGIQGLLAFIDLFPALALTSLVIPFGLKAHPENREHRFSPQFFMSFKTSIITGIVASTIYGLIFTLALPTAKNYEAELLYESRLFLLAKERAQQSAAEGDWLDAAQLLAICERIWPDSPETAQLITEVEIRLESALLYRGPAQDPNALPAYRPMVSQPVDVTGALEMAEAAIVEERYFDAHWLATLASRLATPNSPEMAAADRLAGRAWSRIGAMAPTARETAAFNNYRLKREGHEAMAGDEWIRAYYIFRELQSLTPDDPDVSRYLAICETGVKNLAFFIDEIELSLGQILTGAIFSLPMDTKRNVQQSRIVMRISSLSTAPDYAYGIGTEMMAFDRDGRPLWSMTVPYTKILPLILESGPALSIFLRALDREDQSIFWEPEITSFGEVSPGSSDLNLPISWETFLLLSDVRRGIHGLSTVALRQAADNLGVCGHLHEVFETELLERFTRPLFLLPFCIFAVGMGWQYRAIKRPRYMGIPMLGILPVVFYAAESFGRSFLNNLGIWAVINFGFTTAAVLFAIGIVIMLILSFLVLASKHG